MAAGCAVVSSWLPELERLLDDPTRAHLTLLRDEEPARYAEALAAWLDDPEGLDAVGIALRRAALERYSWDVQADRLSAFYRVLVTRASGRCERSS
jgi:glycosyltransferase involved in cell wall biosynthesis